MCQQEELKEKEESVRTILEEEHERELWEMQLKLDEDLNMKEDTMRQEEWLQKKMNEEKEKYDVKILEKEAWTKQQLMDREDKFNNLLTELRQPLENRAQQWVLKMKELENQLQESNRKRQEQENKMNEEIQRLSEELFSLQVRHFNICSFFTRFQLIILPHLKHDLSFQQLQTPKDKKKLFWRWKFWRRQH